MDALFKSVAPGARRPPRGDGDAPATPTLPLVGRSAELSQLLDLAKHGGGGRPPVIFVGGESGIGRSRLLGECARRCRGLAIRAFVVRPAEKPTPFSLFQRLLDDMAKVYFPGRTQPEGMPAVVLSLMRGLPVDADPSTVHGGIRAFLASISRIAPLLILVDDLHAADSRSLSALFFLARVFSAAIDGTGRIGLVASYRADELASAPVASELLKQLVGQGAWDLQLRRLNGEEVDGLVRSAFPDREVDARISPLVMAHSQGNPLFAISLLDLMRADGVLSMEGSYVRLAKDRMPELPGNIVDLVVRELSALPPKEQRLLALGSVAGPRLDVEFLTHGLGTGRAEIMSSLKGLARSGHLVRLNGGSYEFDPAVAHEVIYQELVDGARVKFHELRARHLEQTRGTSPELALEIATHLDRAKQIAPAAVYYLLGGRYLRRIFAWSLTRRCFERYAEIVASETQERAEALLGTAEALLEMGHLPEAEAPLKEAIELCKKLDLSVYRGHAIMLSARRLFMVGDSRAALVAARLAEELFEKMGEESALAKVVELKGEILHRSGAIDEAEIALEAALLLTTKVGDKAGRSSILLKLARIARETCRLDRALHYIEQALDTTRDVGDQIGEAAVIHQAGLTRWLRGERAEGRKLIRQAVQLAQRHANPLAEAEALADLGYIQCEEGDLKAAVSSATEARDLWRALSERPGEARAHAILASAYAQTGPHDEARVFGSAAALVLDEVGDRRTKAWVQAVLARVALVTHDAERAQELATESLGAAEKLDDHAISGLALSVLGVLSLEKGDGAQARDLLERALADLAAARADTHLPRVRSALGRAHYLLGDVDRGLKLLQDAIGDADELGSAMARAETMVELGRSFPEGSPEGQVVLESALEVATQAGLAPMVERIKSLIA